MRARVLIMIAVMMSVSCPVSAYVPDDLDFIDLTKEEPVGSGSGRSSSGERITVKTIGYEMVYIPPGTFMMGSPSSEPERYSVEDQHRVKLSRGFYMGVTEVTQAQWRKVMGSNPSSFSNCDNCPVERVSWEDVQEFIRKLNRMEGTDRYRLPSEAQWEYACRAGTDTPFNTGRCLSTDQANYNGNYPLSGCTGGTYRKKTLPVKSFSPNAWGLYDMHGNVWEWCSDWYGKYPTGSVTDPEGPSSGSFRVERGGSWLLSLIHISEPTRPY